MNELVETARRTTRFDPAIALVRLASMPDFISARRREAQLKRWSRAKKEALVAGDTGWEYRVPPCRGVRRRANFRPMSTLAEIESAVDALPRPEQETLLQHLARKLGGATPGSVTSEADVQRRQRWLGELRQLRERNATGRTGAPLQQVMDDLRGERA